LLILLTGKIVWSLTLSLKTSLTYSNGLAKKHNQSAKNPHQLNIKTVDYQLILEQ